MPDTPNANTHPAPTRRSALERLARANPRRLDPALMVFIALLAGVVFAHTIDGGWVYDDKMQIANNPLIKDPALVGRALTTDVWSFRTTGKEAGSRYWRPTFVAWMIAHQRLFGLQDILAWRASAILTHMLASVLAFRLARRIGLAPLLAGAVGVIFAIHPSRVESVAWISGVTDPMLALFLFGALLLAMGAVERVRPLVSQPSPPPASAAGVGRLVPAALLLSSTWRWGAALGLYVLALGTKEVALLFPGVLAVACLRWNLPRAGGSLRLDRGSIAPALVAIVPFAAMGAVYLIVRSALLPAETIVLKDDDLPFSVNIFTLPQVGLFYLIQSLCPFSISPVYSIAHVLKPTLSNFFLPGLGLLGAGLALLWAAVGSARGPVTALGFALFVCIIAPAAYVTHFPPDYLVHDRYLYIPLMGLLLMIMGVVVWVTRRIDPAKTAAGVFAVGVLAMSLLGWQTLRYAEAWKQDLTIWKWGHEHDKNSHFCLHHYALELVNESIRKIEEGDKAEREGHGEEAKRLRDQGHADREHARQLFKRALEIRPAGPTFLALADTYFLDSMYNQAESLMVMTINAYRESNFYPTEYMYAVDSLARVYLERDDNLDAAVKVYRDALPHVPGIKARIYDRMAMITIRWAQIHDPAPDRWDQALAVLEEGRAAVGADKSLEAHMLDYRLGQVYARKGRLDEAVARFEAFLKGVQGLDDANVAEAAEIARSSIEQIRKLRSSGPSSGTR